jgi:hypothetical protein
MNARLIGKDARGRKLYRVPVRVTFNNSGGTIDDWISPPFVEFDVIAHSAVDAANWTAREYESRPETEIVAFGPQGGRTRRFISWDRAIGAELFNRGARTAPLF